MGELHGPLVCDEQASGSVAKGYVHTSQQCIACGLDKGMGDPLHNIGLTAKARLHSACEIGAVGIVICL